MRGLDDFCTQSCAFGCGGSDPDSIEHYVHCKTLQEAGDKVLNGIRWRNNTHNLRIPKGIEEVLLFKNSMENGESAFCATWIYLIYAAYNGFLHSQSANSLEVTPCVVSDFMQVLLNDLQCRSKCNPWLW